MFRSINSFLNMIFKSAEKENLQKKNERGKKTFTPTYLLIQKDLENKQFQIFEAAVYYLCTIAAQKKKYQTDIIEILNKAILKEKPDSKRALYIKKMMQEKKLF